MADNRFDMCSMTRQRGRWEWIEECVRHAAGHLLIESTTATGRNVAESLDSFAAELREMLELRAPETPAVGSPPLKGD